MSKKSILFVSTLIGWGGSEELWSRTAQRMIGNGFRVIASVHDQPPLHRRLQSLQQDGVDVRPRILQYPFSRRLWRKITFDQEAPLIVEMRKLIASVSPSLIVLSSGGVLFELALLELCAASGVPFVTIAQANTESAWPEDEQSAAYHRMFQSAARCYFVSRSNLRLFEKQLGGELSNAEVVHNPFNVSYQASPSWPEGADDELLFACVGRLHPPSKGQDVLLEALASAAWMNRKWRLTLYGEGPMRSSLQRLVHRLGLTERVVFSGHVDAIEDIWASNQVLIMPSRLEGLPLAMVEAMLCGRPVIATNVGGNAEILEDGVNGFLAESPTVPALLRALEKLWECRAQLRQLGTAAGQRIRHAVPPDPVGEFVGKLRKIANLA